MTDVLAGTAAPAEVVTPPGAQPVIAPDAPTGQEQAKPDESVKPPRVYTDEEVRKITSDRLSKERRRLERTVRAEVERDYLRQQVEQRQPQEREQPQPKGEPQAKDYQEYEEYLLAKAEYRLEQKQAKQRESTQRETAQQQEQGHERAQAQALMSRFAEARKKHEDFDDVVFAPEAPFTKPMTAFFGESEKGGDIAYHLANNLDEATRIAGLTPAGVFRELVKLEATLSLPPKPTQVPPPIVPGGGAAAVKKDWKDMTTDEHRKEYHARKKRR